MSLLITWVAIWAGQIQKELTALTRLVQQINLEVKDTERLQLDFFSQETINPDFYEAGGKSPLVQQTHEKIQRTQRSLDTLNLLFRKYQLEIALPIDSVQELLSTYGQLFDSLVWLSTQRGFKNYGIEGKMREAIHTIEQAPYPTDMVTLLMIRRHEKDFILRKEPKYIRLLTQKVEKLRAYTQNKLSDAKARTHYDSLLVNYHQYFLQLTELERQIGFHSRDGLKAMLPEYTQAIDRLIKQISQRVSTQAEEVRQRAYYILLSVVLFSILFGVVLGTFVSRKLGKPIKVLSRSINQVIENDFRGEIGSGFAFATNDEITTLANDFRYMLAKIQERTAELEQQKEEISTQAESLRGANAQIQKKSRSIISSINYAKRIQDAVLPDTETRLSLLPDSFVFYKPRDIVSGDFYWVEQLEDKMIIAAADCTGHGVPGALMSVLGINAFRNILIQEQVWQPDQILNRLNQRIRTTLRQEHSSMHDGMDIALAVWEPAAARLYFSGAKNPLVRVREGKMEMFKGDRSPIGGLPKEFRHPFTLHTLEVQEGDQFYMYSDGYQDQFGGEKDRKLLSKNFRKLLLEHAHLSAAAQHDALKQHLKNWMGNRRQIDDIMVFGFRL